VRCTRGDVRDHTFQLNRLRTSVAASKGAAEAEKSKNQLSRDFQGCSIFDFCNNICVEKLLTQLKIASGPLRVFGCVITR
jgi:hypothetical protein